jgi:hypothetical protein
MMCASKGLALRQRVCAVKLAENVRQLAFELARSGRHVDSRSIEAELADAGYPEAYVVLQEPALHKSLDELCAQHRRPTDPS